MYRYSDSKGIVSIRGRRPLISSSESPAFCAATISAASVGSPCTMARPSSLRTSRESLHSKPAPSVSIERDVLAHDDGRFLEVNLPDRLVAAAGDVVEPSAGMDFLHGHLILRERAGLVRANDGGAAERLDGGQLADDRLPPRHA